MHIAKDDVPVRINAPGAKARQQTGFGDASGYGTMGGEFFSLDAGTDITGLLAGLEGDMCQAPHWGYVLKGKLTVTYGTGEEETTRQGDLFYWPPGHTVRAEEAADFVMFSPQHEHDQVMDHILDKVGSKTGS